MAVERNAATKMWEAHIDGKLYEFEKYGALEATQLLFDLGAITGKPLGSIAQKTPSSADAAQQATASTFSMVIEKLADALVTHRELALKILLKLSSGNRVLCEGKPIGKFDDFYTDDLMLAFDVAKTNLEVQYGNFFAAAGKRLGLLKGTAAQSLPNTISNG